LAEASAPPPSRTANAILATVALLAVAYLGDWAVWKARGASGRGQVQIRTYYSVPAKGNKVDFMPGETVGADCVHSIFSHDGVDACWWAARHSEQRVDL
jgi:hypothetical protein